MEDNFKDTDKLLNENDEFLVDFSSHIQKIVLKWKNLNYRVKTGDTYFDVLKNITGYSNPGEILAVMGASGSGKTSLLSLLANRVSLRQGDEFKGEIYANSKSIYKSDFHSYLKFITQENILFEFLTPFEYLKFNLMLKMKISDSEANKRVESIIHQFKLSEVKHTLIGDAIVRGISGGEKKRLCIAAELMLYPSILVLDEPTSGLDSYLAKNLISILNEVKQLGVNIIMSVHQPSSEIFQMFDRLVLMQEGSILYQGNASESINYFEESGFNIPKRINPPELYMRILKIEDRNSIKEDEKSIMETLHRRYTETQEEIWKDMKSKIIINDVSEISLVPDSLFRSVRWLFWRECLNYKRNPLLNVFKIFQASVFSLICDMAYSRFGYDNEGVENRRGAIICYLFALHFLPNFTVIMNITLERKSTTKEIQERLYGLHSYFIVKIIMESIFGCISIGLSVSIIYYICGFNTETYFKALVFWLISGMVYTQGVFFGLLGGSLTDSVFVANVYGSVIAVSLMVFAGYFNDPEAGPLFFRWLKYCTPCYFLRNAIYKNEFDDLDIDDNVYPIPEIRFNYKGEIYENILISFIHLIAAYIIAYLIYSYRIYKAKIDN